MIIKRIVGELFAANCYVLLQGSGAVVVDPGQGVREPVLDTLRQHGASLQAVLLTHGHVDHVWDAAKLAGTLPVYISQPDRYRLDSAYVTDSVEYALLRGMLPGKLEIPDRIEEIPPALFEGAGAELVPGFTFRALAAPGHTEGSTVFLTPPSQDLGGMEHELPESAAPLLLSGDVIFQGSVGRTDLPGGDPAVMEWTLRTLSQVVDPATILLPGHGPASTVGQEKATNPFLQPGAWKQF